MLCHRRWPGDRLYSACRCYKKSDSNRLHKECLASVYATKETDDLPRCPGCHEIFSVSVRYNFLWQWNRVCACRSVAHLCEMIIILLMIGCGIFTIVIFWQSKEYQDRHRTSSGGHSPRSGESDWATYLIYVLFGMTMCLVPVTLKKVFERWRNVNSDVEVDIV